MRYQFNEVFDIKGNQFAPRRRIRVGGVSFGPGISFGENIAFGGVNFSQFKDHEIEAVEDEEGVLVIKGIY